MFAVVFLCFLATACTRNQDQGASGDAAMASRPNIVLIVADDLGYGDVGYYNADSKIQTPNIDGLAREGVAFSDAHSPGPICGPSRYGLLTGRYSWRNPGGSDNGHDYDSIKVEPDRPTIATMFHDMGYNTAQIGKWGLRYDYRAALKDPQTPLSDISPASFDYSKPILGPNLRGFDYAFSSVTLAGGRRKAPGVGKAYFENGYPYGGGIPQPAKFDYGADLEITTRQVVAYLQDYAAVDTSSSFSTDRADPFFLYFDMIAPHAPYAPNEKFVGKSGAGIYGDLVAEIDYRVGEIIAALKEVGLYENSIVIFTSDNGPESTAYQRARRYGHYSMGPWRGVKSHLWEGGTRVPLIIRGPGVQGRGRWVDEPVSLTDLFRSFAEIVGYELSKDVAEDSNSLISLLRRQPEQFSQQPIIYQNSRGDLAIRDGDWVLIDAPSGGRGRREPQWFRDEIGVSSHEEPRELFNLRVDPQQRKNLYAERPDIAKRLSEKLAAIKG